MVTDIDVLFPGYSAAADFGALGWGTVALIKADHWSALLDAGCHSNRRQLPARIQQAGVQPEDIRYIFLTHLHWDHANNIDLFPQAELFISKAEWEFVTHFSDAAYYPPTIEAIAKRGPTLIDANGETLVEGVSAYLTPGHTAGSTTYLADCGGTRCALVGDAAKNWYELQTGCVKMTRDAQASARSIELIRSLSRHILPGHDGWVDITDGAVCPRHGNDVILSFPQGVTMGGNSELRLYMDDPH